MFQYTDPGKTLKPASALKEYRSKVHAEYLSAAKSAGSAFTLLEAFKEVAPGRVRTALVDWAAFPRSAQVSNDQIDRDRFTFQDEYVEWRVQRTGQRITTITFTTDFLAYYDALARAGAAEMKAAIKAAIPGANPTNADLFGAGFNPATSSEEARGRRFTALARQNPWINGSRGILCLAHTSSTLGALFGLVNAAAVPLGNIPTGDVCAQLGGNCVSSRNSDPSIASAVQAVARSRSSLTLADPVGVEIAKLAGIWRVGNTDLDINDAAANNGIWTVTRTGRRAELRVVPGLLLDDSPITSGAQVAAVLRVQATVLAAADADLPEWARLGHESSQRLTDVAGGNS